MRRISLGASVAFGILAVLLLSAAPSTQQPGRGRAGRLVERVNGHDAAAGEVIVKFRATAAPADVSEVAALADADQVVPIGRTGARRLRSRSMNAARLLALLAGRDDVAYAEPNYIVHAFTEPNDARFPELWGLKNVGQNVNGGLPGTAGADIHAPQAWDASLGSSAVVVGVVDTGIDYTHEDLVANVWSAPAPFTVTIGGTPITCPAGSHGFNAITLSCDPMDDHDHGTHVSGTIGADGNNGIGVVGVNWIARLMGIKFLDASGSGTEADAVNAIEFAIQTKQAFAATGAADVRVLSNSWGGTDFSQALLDEINAANDHDMLFVAAAGNYGFTNDILPIYPASYQAPNVISVAATTNTDARAWFSNWGAASVHLGAPGVDILSTTRGNTYQFLSGTSMATPHVSGAAALVLSRCDLDTADLKQTLLSTVDPVAGLAGITITGGRLNVDSAIRSCLGPPPTPADLTAEGNDGVVTLHWTTAPGATGYAVKRSLTSGGPYDTIAQGVTGTTYADTGVVNGTTYYYVLSATNGMGQSGDSNEASATPNPLPDLVISALTVPSTGGAGAPLVVTETVRNQGAGTADPSTTRFYLSSDTIVDAADVELAGVHAVPTLTAGASSSASVSLTIPGGAPVGLRYVIAVADADQAIREVLDTNNTAARLVQIGPDLVISALTVPATAAPGATISIADSTMNKGGGAAEASATKFYLSTDAAIDAGDTLLGGGRAVAALAAGATSSGSTAVTIPSSLPAGPYFVIAKADADGAVAETQEFNNLALRSIKIGGDLVVSALSAPGTAGPGATIVIGDTTTNQGLGAVSASVTRFYFSADLSLDSGDAPLGGRGVPALAAGASSSASTAVVLPAGLAAGTYYIFAKADADDVVVEAQEGNNTALRSIQIGGDLVVSALTVPAQGSPGAVITITDTTTNQGSGGVAASATRFYLSADSGLDAGDVLLSGSHAVPALAAGASSTASTAVTLPANLGTGFYYLFAKADADGAVAETQEFNNIALRSIQIGGDLVVSAFTVPSTGGAGGDIVVTDTTKNQGLASVPASTTRFYLSTDVALGPGDTPLSGGRAVPLLAPGATSAGSTTLSLPPGLASGVYFVIAKADADGVVPETQEGNNTAIRLIQIGGDLVVSALSVPVQGAAGGSILVADTTANQGSGDVEASTTRFYLSANTLADASDLLLPGGRGVPALAAGAGSSGSTTLTIPPGTPAGIYYIVAAADGDHVVAETQEWNNTTARRITVGPDLAVSIQSITSSAVAGSTIAVTDTVTDIGGGAAGASTTRYYLSANIGLDASDVLLDGFRAVPALTAGQSSAGTTVLTIPADTPAGFYFVVPRADADDAVLEAQEGNNTAFRSVLVTVP